MCNAWNTNKTRSVDVAKKADRTENRTTHAIAVEQNRRKCRIWNNHGHVTTPPMAILDAEILAVRLFVVSVTKRHILQ